MLRCPLWVEGALPSEPEAAEQALQAKVNKELADFERLNFKPFDPTRSAPLPSLK